MYTYINNNRNGNFQISKATLERQAQGASFLTSAATNQRGC